MWGFRLSTIVACYFVVTTYLHIFLRCPSPETRLRQGFGLKSQSKLDMINWEEAVDFFGHGVAEILVFDDSDECSRGRSLDLIKVQGAACERWSRFSRIV